MANACGAVLVNDVAGASEPTWEEVHDQLCALATQRAGLDADEAVLLCSATRLELWRHFGRASFLEYLEDVLGYTPKCARERIRVATALDSLPALSEALAHGEQSYSAIRELTRVATPETEIEWRDAAREKNVRQIEELVAVHAPGDRPSDRPQPDLKPRVVRFEISTATFARLRQVQQVLAAEHGTQLDDDALVATMCAAILDGDGAGETDQGRARFQIMTTLCSACGQGWQDGAGREIAVSATDVAIAECDAQRIGSDREPSRASQDVTPKVRRHVWRRDKRHCQVPGCRAARNVDVHHLKARHVGGGHDEDNLILLCSGHHRSLHDGTITITGKPGALVVTWNVPHVAPEETKGLPARTTHLDARHAVPAQLETRARNVVLDDVADASRPSHVGRSSKYERVVMRTDAIQAIRQSGFVKEARMLVDTALAAAPDDITLEQLLVRAFQLSKTLA